MIKQKQRINALTFCILLFGVMMLGSCEDDNFGEVNDDQSSTLIEKGVFIVNEGNFGGGSGSLSFFSYDSLNVSHNLFFNANNRPLGDVPQSLTIVDSLGFVVVNNSGKIEVININNAASLASIENLSSPRFLLPVTNQKAYVSDFSTRQIRIVDLESYTVTGSVDIGRTSERMVGVGDKVFVGNWSAYHQPGVNNNQLVVINATMDTVVDSIRVVKEPNSMVVDRNEKLWVLCSGGFENDVFPALLRINPADHSVEKTFDFEHINKSPEELCINGTGDTLFYIDEDIYAMSVNSFTLPDNSLIEAGERNFKALNIDQQRSWLFASDAIDYQQKGIVFQFSTSGTEIRSFRAGIIPGYFAFYPSVLSE